MPNQPSDPFLLTETEKKLVSTCSVERMINTTLQILESHPLSYTNLKDEHLGELVSINHQDWEDMKTVVCKIFDRERNAIFIEKNPTPTPTPTKST